MLFPPTALETAKRIPDVVNTLVDRAKHVAIVKGLNKNLFHGKYANILLGRPEDAYHAATDTPSHRTCFRTAECSLDLTDWPEAEIVTNACAFKRSIMK